MNTGGGGVKYEYGRGALEFARLRPLNKPGARALKPPGPPKN